MHPLQQQIDNLRKYHEALGTKLASLERHLEADEVLKAPTMDRQNCTVSSDSSVMHEGKRYSFKYSGAAIENVLILKAYPRIIHHAGGVYYTEAITNVREVKEPAKEWEIVEFRNTGTWDGKKNIMFVRDECGSFGLVDGFRFTEDHMLNGAFGSVKDGQWAIHAVARLSDGTVWKVGDNVINDTGGTGKITEFRLTQGVMTVNADCYFSFSLLSRLKRPKPLFYTADDVPCYAGDKVCCWGTLSGPGEMIEAKDWMKPEHFYSTREAAQAAYDKWLFEQPVLTLNDITQDGFPLEYLETMKRIVKEKIAKK